MEESTSREKVLKKVRHALIYKSDNPFAQADLESPVMASLKGSLDVHFAETFTSLGGIFVYCESQAELVYALAGLHQEKEWGNVFCSDKLLQYHLNQASIPFESADESTKELQVAITGCELLVARTGTIVMSALQGRRTLAFPESLVVVAYPWQLAEGIAQAIERLTARYGNEMPSMLTFVTGPSRTADIEKTLVLGAHGPKQVFLILVEQKAV